MSRALLFFFSICFWSHLHCQDQIIHVKQSVSNLVQAVFPVDEYTILVSTYGIKPWDDSVRVVVLKEGDVVQDIDVGRELDLGLTYFDCGFENNQLKILVYDYSCCDCVSYQQSVIYDWGGDRLFFNSLQKPDLQLELSTSFYTSDSIKLNFSNILLQGHAEFPNGHREDIHFDIDLEGFRHLSYHRLHDAFIVLNQRPWSSSDSLIIYPHYTPDLIAQWFYLANPVIMKVGKDTFVHVEEEYLVLESEDALEFRDTSLSILSKLSFSNPRMNSVWYDILGISESIERFGMPPYFIHKSGIDVLSIDSTEYSIIKLDTSFNLISKETYKTPPNTYPYGLYRVNDELMILGTHYDQRRRWESYFGGQIECYTSIWKEGETGHKTCDLALLDMKIEDDLNAAYKCNFWIEPHSYRNVKLNDITLTIANFGEEDVHGFYLNYFLNQMSTCVICQFSTADAIYMDKEIKAGESIQITIPGFYMYILIDTGEPDLCFWTSAPNGTIDVNWENDQICQAFQVSDSALTSADIEIFPNPADDKITISYDKYIGEETELKIYDNQGQMIFENKYADVFSEDIRIDITSYSSGMYFVYLTVGEITIHEKLIVL